jgi:Family of unknown function (DUF6232)
MTASNTEVKVSKRVLWIGGDAYPLQNIARAQVRTLIPRSGTAFKNFAKNLTLSALASILVGIALPADYALITAIILVSLSVYRFARALQGGLITCW